MKIATIVGARPQFIKAAAVSRVIRERDDMQEVLIHTGQHYDENMSAVFFQELKIPQPDYHLGIGSASHGAQTGRMLEAIEKVLLKERPDWVLVYGDTNSTLAGALAAVKLHMPVAHVEAGLRSFNRRMPEEINRVLADHVSDLLFCPTSTAVENLRREGIIRGVHQVGDVMYDSVLFHARQAEQSSTILHRLELEPGSYYLATIHRAENTDDPARLHAILEALRQLPRATILPVHPRTRKTLGPELEKLGGLVRAVPPVSYLDMLTLERHARAVLTDSGGVQKEAYWFGVPCITLRDETEWMELVEAGVNRVVGAQPARILQAVADFDGWHSQGAPIDPSTLYGDGHSTERIVRLLAQAESASHMPSAIASFKPRSQHVIGDFTQCPTLAPKKSGRCRPIRLSPANVLLCAGHWWFTRAETG